MKYETSIFPFLGALQHEITSLFFPPDVPVRDGNDIEGADSNRKYTLVCIYLRVSDVITHSQENHNSYAEKSHTVEIGNSCVMNAFFQCGEARKGTKGLAQRRDRLLLHN